MLGYLFGCQIDHVEWQQTMCLLRSDGIHYRLVGVFSEPDTVTLCCPTTCTILFILWYAVRCDLSTMTRLIHSLWCHIYPVWYFDLVLVPCRASQMTAQHWNKRDRYSALNPLPTHAIIMVRVEFNPLDPHDVSKHHFASLKYIFIFYNLGLYNNNFHGTVLIITVSFLHLPPTSSSSTTSRELRQQFAACSGWKWHH